MTNPGLMQKGYVGLQRLPPGRQGQALPAWPQPSRPCQYVAFVPPAIEIACLTCSGWLAAAALQARHRHRA